MPDYSKQEVRYRPAERYSRSCGACMHFLPKRRAIGLGGIGAAMTGDCTLVKGRIHSDDTCDKFTPETELAELAEPNPSPALTAANRYLNLLRKKAKRDYGFAYLSWLRNGAVGVEPTRPKDLSYMGAQAVRLELHKILGPDPFKEAQSNPRRIRKPTTWAGERDEFFLESWEERDRIHLALYFDPAAARSRHGHMSGDGELVAEWWDDDARQMFEDGFFSTKPRPGVARKHALEDSVIRYLQDVGVVKLA